ncbi:MAG: 60S ribosomal protein L22 [Candidatus Bathyarchaeota archaeon]|nr:60S ribosomal protein L22 [Candidatus Bathyarchaeota archaeon]
MSTVIVDVSELSKFDGSSVKALATFMESRIDGTVASAKNEVTLDFEEGKAASKSCLRLLLRKFLHKQALKEDFRVISGGENSFIIKEKKVYEE